MKAKLERALNWVLSGALIMGFAVYPFDFVSKRSIYRDAQNWDGTGNDNFWDIHKISAEEAQKFRRDFPIEPTLSVIIPCYYKHAKYLYSLLHMFERQTRLPDEIVIAISELSKIDSEIIHQLEKELWAFPVTIVASDAIGWPGKNRNIACSYAKGDVFMCQDADDIPHPQRVEIMHYFFSHYEIVHLMHEFKTIRPLDTRIPFHRYEHFHQIEVGYATNFDYIYRSALFPNGNVAITCEIFNAIHWPDIRVGEDTKFNQICYSHFDNCIVIRAILFAYRQFLSSTAKFDIDEAKMVLDDFPSNAVEKRFQANFILLGVDYL